MKAIFDEYSKIAKEDIEESIKGKTSGDIEHALLAIGIKKIKKKYSRLHGNILN